MAGKQGFLIVSDLHLSEGRNPRTGWIDPREDFLFDDDFADFLGFHTCSGEWDDIEWTLIIAGDFVDFLQVTEMPPGRPDLQREGDYGLVAGPAESAWKIRRIMRGHPVLFSALAKFGLDHRIVFVSGNHDAEFFYSEVREALIDGLQELTNSLNGSLLSGNHLLFCPWFFFDRNIYVEHGHQFDPVNAFPSALVPVQHSLKSISEESSKNIFLPLGSIFVRYLFNRVETSSPFADNVKPETRFIGWFIKNHPIRAFLFLVTDGRKMLRKIKEGRKITRPRGNAVIPDSRPEDPADGLEQGQQLLREREEWARLISNLEKIQVEPLLSGTEKPAVGVVLLMLGPTRVITLLLLLLLLNMSVAALFLSPFWSLMLPVPILESPFIQGIVDWNRNFQIPLMIIFSQVAVWCFVYLMVKRHRKKHNCSRVLREKASKIEKILHPEYIIMGHCHEPDLFRFSSGCQYINTGTWT
ncbi:MAG: hypothetical protein ABIJ42_02230, partial [Acidobacteriota bacterium]